MQSKVLTRDDQVSLLHPHGEGIPGSAVGLPSISCLVAANGKAIGDHQSLAMNMMKTKPTTTGKRRVYIYICMYCESRIVARYVPKVV